MQILLDTNVLLRHMIQPGKLSRDQTKILDQADASGLDLGISVATLTEIAILCSEGACSTEANLDQIFESLQQNNRIRLYPLTYEIAREVAALKPILIDPSDCIIAATARVQVSACSPRINASFPPTSSPQSNDKAKRPPGDGRPFQSKCVSSSRRRSVRPLARGVHWFRPGSPARRCPFRSQRQAPVATSSLLPCTAAYGCWCRTVNSSR